MGFFSSIFGGGGKTKVVTTTTTKNNQSFDINPQTAVELSVDTDPIGKGLSDIGKAIESAVSAEAFLTIEQFEFFKKNFNSFKDLLVIGGVSFAAYFFFIKKSKR